MAVSVVQSAFLALPSLMYNPPMRRPRVRHHTSDASLEQIRVEGAIRVSRGWEGSGLGVHVEVEPFGTTRPFREGKPSPKADMGLVQDGAFVEFDAPAHLIMMPYRCGQRNAAVILTEVPLSLAGLNSRFVKVRRAFWEFWRNKAK
jgi:hypothetical protein